MATPTIIVGKQKLVFPDIGYEAGLGLRDVLRDLFAELSNQINDKWSGEVTLANNATINVEHNFNAALAQLLVQGRYTGSDVWTKELQDTLITVTFVNTNTIQIQNISGGNLDFEVHVSLRKRLLVNVDEQQVISSQKTFTVAPIVPSTFTIGANSFTRSGAHNLTLTTTGATTATLPSGTVTLAALGVAQTFTALQTFSGGISGNITGNITGELISRAAFSVVGRSANSVGNSADIVAGANGVLRRSGTGDLIFGTLVTANVGDSQVTYAKIQNTAGFSVLGKSTTGAGAVADLVAGIDGVLRRSGSGNLEFGTLVTNNIGNSQVTYAKIQNTAGFSVLGKSTTGAGVVTDLVAGTDSVLRRSGSGNLEFGTLVTNNIGNSQVTYAKIQNTAGFSVLGKSTTGAGVVTDLVAGTDSVLRRSGSGNLEFGTLVSNHLGSNIVTFDKIQQLNANGVLGRGSGNGNPQEILSSTDTVLCRVGSNALDFSQLVTNHIGNSQVTYAKIQNTAGFSVLGKSTTGAGAVTDLVAGTDHFVLRRSGTTLGFGLLTNNNIDASAAIARTKIANGTANRVLVNNGSGVFSDSTMVWDFANSRLGIGRTPTTDPFEVQGVFSLANGTHLARISYTGSLTAQIFIPQLTGDTAFIMNSNVTGGQFISTLFTFSGPQTTFSDVGSASAPTITIGNQQTGFFQKGSSGLAVSVNGQEKLNITGNGAISTNENHRGGGGLVPVGTIVALNYGHYTNGTNGGFTSTVANTAAGINTLLNGTGWYACDGAAVNNSASPIWNAAGRFLPKLNDDRFLMGSSGAGTAGGATGNTINLQHSHTLSGSTANHTLTTAQIPSHTHTINHTHASFNTASGGAHIHTVTTRDFAWEGFDSPLNVAIGRSSSTARTTTVDNTNSAHAHSIAVPAFSASSGSTGTGNAHSHGVGTLANANSLSSSQSILPQYLSTHYIIRVF